jgi:hypothetical protein
MTTNFFSPLSFVAVFGSGIRDPKSEIRDPGSGMGKNQDPGSGINIPDPQHCKILNFIFEMLKEKNFAQFSKNYRTFYPKICH